MSSSDRSLSDLSAPGGSVDFSMKIDCIIYIHLYYSRIVIIIMSVVVQKIYKIKF